MLSAFLRKLNSGKASSSHHLLLVMATTIGKKVTLLILCQSWQPSTSSNIVMRFLWIHKLFFMSLCILFLSQTFFLPFFPLFLLHFILSLSSFPFPFPFLSLIFLFSFFAVLCLSNFWFFVL